MQKKIIQRILLVLILLLSVLILLAVSLVRPLREDAKVRSIPGLVMMDMDFGNLTYDEIETLLVARLEKMNDHKVIVEINGERKETTLSQLEAGVDLVRTLESIYDRSFNQNLFLYLMRRAQILFTIVELEPVVVVDREAVETEIERLFPEVGRPKSARLTIEGSKFSVIPSQTGLDVDFEQVVEGLREQIGKLQTPVIMISAKKMEPEYTSEEATIDGGIASVLLNHQLTVKRTVDSSIIYRRTFMIQRGWFSVRRGVVEYFESEIQNFLTAEVSPEINVPSSDAYLRKLPDEADAKGEVSGLAKDGYELDILAASKMIVEIIQSEGFASDLVVIELPVRRIPGKIVNETEYELGEMTLLGQGRSDYKGSPYGRDYNIEKGLNEKMNNIFVPPGEEFSFNSYLGPVTSEEGWKDALAIFNGDELRAAAGGGLCQVSTTVYRAALKAGLPITERYNHSIYVHYYARFGDGLDATIYPPAKDLRFMNDTKHYILVQAYHEGDIAVINIFGVSDGRSAELVGPIYPGKVPEHLIKEVFPAKNQIVWKYIVTRADGKKEEKLLVSTYITR